MMARLFSLIKYPIMIIACLGMMIMVSWKLTIFVFLMLPFVGLVMGRVGKKLKAKSLASQNKWGDILSNAEETIGGLRVIKAFNAEKMMERRFARQTQDFFRINNSVNRRTALAHPMSEFLGTTAIAIILWFGGSLIVANHSDIDGPTFIYYMVMFYSLINPAKDLSKTSYTIRKGMAAKERIDKILNAVNPITDPERPVELGSTRRGEQCGVSFRDVSFGYNAEHDVLRHINLEVKPGETVAVVGQSGSGKSTLVDLIPRFWDVERGEILIDEVNVKDYGERAIAALCATHDLNWFKGVAEYAHVYVFWNENKIVGVGSISSFWGSLTESILLTIFVLPEFHGQGIGSYIIDTLESDELFLRAERIEIPASITAVEFYRKKGYEYKNGIKELDVEQHYQLEKFRKIR